MDQARVLATMSMTMRAFLVNELAKYMKNMPASQARVLADELTILVSAHIKEDRQVDTLEASPLRRLPSFPQETWNELTAGVPWEAYSFAHGVYEGHLIEDSVQALCSAPSQLDIILSEQAIDSGLWGGSLLVSLGKILERVNRDLILFAPYWRVEGVQSLLAAAGRASYAGVSVTVFSQPKFWMKAADKDGLAFFIETLRRAGAQVRALAPRTNEGVTPILHAKLIIVDGVTAYVGSANFTRSGLDHGLEAGVLVSGKTANDFSRWSKTIAASCEAW
jgi:phosphatidylserine/phosphatidylglycerophosphate/cardiolipin synthase-like enzyme